VKRSVASSATARSRPRAHSDARVTPRASATSRSHAQAVTTHHRERLDQRELITDDARLLFAILSGITTREAPARDRSPGASFPG
jgi:hypothetical protein